MSRYIDIIPLSKNIAVFKKSINSPNSDYMKGYICALSVTEGIIANQILKQSTVDMVAVVRCGECVHRTSGRQFCQGRPKDWFCANGERRWK